MTEEEDFSFFSISIDLVLWGFSVGKVISDSIVTGIIKKGGSPVYLELSSGLHD